MDKSKQTLPTKENSLFKRILKSYEQKQYKNGLKFAKQILTNFPDHGETLAMKGLTLNCLGRKEDAYNFVRSGLRNNLQSHVCWHVYGLLQRSDKKYEEAIKCYRNALKWDKDNLQILRDLSLLQIQMRDLEGYKDTRYRLFDLRPTQRASWIGYAMSFHLLRDYEMALKILEEFRKTIRKSTYDYEYSELLLYQNMVMREHCQYEEALKHLDTFKSNICDKITLQEVRGEILMEMGRMEDASEVYKGLIARNPENRNYYLLLEKTLNLTDQEKLDHYENLKKLFPRAHVPRRLPLDYATGDDLEKILDPYLRAGLLKGVPPLFTDVLSLYSDPSKIALVEKLLTGYLKSLQENGYLSKEDSDYREPTCMLFVLMFLAQHYNHLGDSEKALDLLQSALEHTPTLIELYILKGKILKHAGDYKGAHETLIEAQSLDTADRYVNSKAASYLLTSNLVSAAEGMCSKFTREEVSAMENLNEMQCMWFQTECAMAYLRLKQYGDALKKCHEVDRHFTEIIEDQFDFHTYCMRKMTLRSYIELLRLEDGLRNNRAYWEAAKIAIKIYLRLYDKPITDVKEIVDTSKMSVNQLKKYRQQQRKAKKAEQEKEEERKREEEKKQNKHKHKSMNEDPESCKPEALIPSKLERPEDPLAEAIYFLKPLQSLSSQRIETHIFAFEIFIRKQKPLIMLQALKRAFKLDPNNPELHTCIVRFLKYYRTNMGSSNAAVKQVIEQELMSRISTMDPLDFNEKFLNDNQDSIPHRLQAARSMYFLDSVQRERSLSIATDLSPQLKGKTLVNLKSVLEWLESSEFNASESEIAHYKSSCSEVFPRAMNFKPYDTNSSSSPTYSTANSSSPTTTTVITNSIVNAAVTTNHNHVNSES